MTTKYNIGDTVLIPFYICGIRIDEKGVSYRMNVDPNLVIDEQTTYFLDRQANISEQNIDKLIERGFK